MDDYGYVLIDAYNFQRATTLIDVVKYHINCLPADYHRNNAKEYIEEIEKAMMHGKYKTRIEE